MWVSNPDAAEKLYHNLKRKVKNMGNFPLWFSDSEIKYRGYIIHKRIYESYLFFISSIAKRKAVI